jgi:Dolichyl-phosphate-mannose-protein mannosyltransferase
MATDITVPRSSISARLLRVGERPRRWPGAAWGAIAVTAAYLGLTCWWLTVDRHIPIFDAGLHLDLGVKVYEHMNTGDVWGALTLTLPYPPFAYLIGALGMAIGGVGVAQPILAENFVFVPLLALGCYKVGRMAFGPLAGLLAVVFAFGSPLVTAQFHVFMIDAPETAMVAVSVWAILATERFSRIDVSVLAGVAVGLGMLTKEPVAIFVAGPLAVTAIRGGWQAWRGVAAFAAVALAISLWWYIAEYSTVQGIQTEALHGTNVQLPGGIAPPRGSLVNYEWYLWNIINWQLLLPLTLFAAVGWVWALVGFVRRRWVSPLAPELAIGAFVGWFGLTETFVHDNRYSMPLLIYLAVFGSFWIVRLPQVARIATGLALVAIVIVNTLGDSFTTGWTWRPSLPSADLTTQQWPGVLTVFSTAGYVISAPAREGDLLGVMETLKRRGVVHVLWGRGRDVGKPHFSNGGIQVLADIAKLDTRTKPPSSPTSPDWRQFAFLGSGPIEAGDPPPCLVLGDGTGVWIKIGNPEAPGARYYCPSQRPQFYG